ncbi:hypothetical protein AB4Z52_32435 [Rhizobium sp. 2YAF20]|uniref:hypothetical protein n=1 Tax=Rhizobium sp. 2YAF20 TaxID=3233027 RepID=UPI003F9E37FD
MGGVVLALAMIFVPDQSIAHSFSVGGSTAGLPIPSLSHGEMAIIAPYQGAIMDLALSALDTNEPFRRVLNFAQIQYAACLWGMMPGGVTDEASPFNECSHAYLAATKAVLLDMRAMPQERNRANDLVSRIDNEMVANSMSLITCEFSAETFNTANVISPQWTAVPSHFPSLIAFTAVLISTSGLGWGGVRLLRRPSNDAKTKLSH